MIFVDSVTCGDTYASGTHFLTNSFKRKYKFETGQHESGEQEQPAALEHDVIVASSYIERV